MEERIYKADEIQNMVKSPGFAIFEGEIEKILKEVRRKIEKLDCPNRDYLAGVANGLQEYKSLITRIVTDGENRARQLENE